MFGLVTAWVLARYDFPGKGFVDALVDLPFALPTAVAGIALTALYAENGWLGRFIEPLGFKVAFAPAGVAVAMIFVGLPFVVRTVQPVLLEIDVQMEEAAATLGATRLQTAFAGDPARHHGAGADRASRSRSRALSANTGRSSSSPATCR